MPSFTGRARELIKLCAHYMKSIHFCFLASKVDYAQAAAALIDSSPLTNVTSVFTVADVPFRVPLRDVKLHLPLRLPEKLAFTSLPPAISIDAKNLPVMLKLPNMTYHASSTSNLDPTFAPTPAPTLSPTPAPTFAPSLAPTPAPTFIPNLARTPAPTFAPSLAPTFAPTFAPSLAPTRPAPTFVPTLAPTPAPIFAPSLAPTPAPTFAPASVLTQATTSAAAPTRPLPQKISVPPANNKQWQLRRKDTKSAITRFFDIIIQEVFEAFFIFAICPMINIIRMNSNNKNGRARRQEFRSSLSLFIRSNGTLRVNIAPASGSPSEGFEAFLICKGTGDCASSMPKKDSRPLPLQYGKARKKRNRTEIDINNRESSYLFVSDRQRYKEERIPPPLPAIQEEPPDADFATESHTAIQEVAIEDNYICPNGILYGRRGR